MTNTGIASYLSCVWIPYTLFDMHNVIRKGSKESCEMGHTQCDYVIHFIKMNDPTLYVASYPYNLTVYRPQSIHIVAVRNTLTCCVGVSGYSCLLLNLWCSSISQMAGVGLLCSLVSYE